jgi:hypothetical protein
MALEQLQGSGRIKRDIDLWSGLEDRVWSGEAFEAVQAQEQERQERQRAYYERNASVRAKMMSQEEHEDASAHVDEAVVFEALDERHVPVEVEQAEEQVIGA